MVQPITALGLIAHSGSLKACGGRSAAPEIIMQR